VDFSEVDDLLKFYYGPDFVMTESALAAMKKFMADRNIGLKSDQPSTREPDDEERAGNPGPAGEDDHDDDEEVDLNLQPGKLDYYGKHIYDELKDFVPVGGKVFEPGASWGKMLLPWKELHGCAATGVEPKKEAVRVAKQRLGIELLEGFADDPRIPENAFDLVINTRTINHMLDPLGDLRNAWRWLKPDGVLFVDIQDAIREARFEGFERNVVEIDHPYMFSLNTLTAMVQKAGFTVIKKEIRDLQQVRDWDDRAPQPKQIRIMARKSIDPVAVEWPDPLAELADLLQAQLEFERGEREKYRQLRENYQQLRENYQQLRDRYFKLKKETRALRASLRTNKDGTVRPSVRLAGILKALWPG
jgi:SAM-dependent methyltransferase